LSSIGKVRQREKWRREEEENRTKVKIIWKTPTTQELRSQVTALLREGEPRDIDAIAEKLRLDVMGKIRLRKILRDMEPEKHSNTPKT
jgi:hypothetical protein